MIAATFDRVIAGEIKRLIVCAPPQHGKSELGSVRFPAYWLSERPNDPVILTSYGADLAYDKSRQVREIIENNVDYRAAYPHINTRRDSRSVESWNLAGYRGYLKAAGVGGPVTGRGAMLGLVDDPFKNWEEAQSLTIRDRVWNWFRTTFRTRIWDGGAIVITMTRWHEDDLVGRLLMDQADEWTVLRLPAIAETQDQRDENNRYLGLYSQVGQPDPLGREPGEPLAPKRYPLAALNSLKKDVGELAWAGQYDQVPRTPEGNRIKRHMLEIVDASPAIAQRVRYWDKASSESDGACYTAAVLMARGQDGVFYIEHVVRERLSAGKREDLIKQTAEDDAMKHGNIVKVYVEREPGSGGKDSADSTVRNLAGFPVEADAPTTNKDARFEPVVAQAEAGNIKIVRGAWNGAYIEEMITIPNGKYRDQGDATAGCLKMLTSVPKKTAAATSAIVAKRNTEPPKTSLSVITGGRK